MTLCIIILIFPLKEIFERSVSELQRKEIQCKLVFSQYSNYNFMATRILRAFYSQHFIQMNLIYYFFFILSIYTNTISYTY